MKKEFYAAVFILTIFLNVSAFGQRETFTGTAVIYSNGFNTRTITRTFRLDINGKTSDQKALQFLDILQTGGQDTLLKEIDKEDLGKFSFSGNIGSKLNVVREERVDGKRRIFAVFERLIGFGELRSGYRSVDYPFSFIEIYIDEKTGRGDGTFIPAARVRFKFDRNSEQNQVEIENFAAFPAKLIGITRR